MLRKKATFNSDPFVEIVKLAQRHNQLNALELFLTLNPNVDRRLKQRSADRLIKELKAGKNTRRINNKEKELLAQFSEEHLGSARHYEWLLDRTDRSRVDQEKLEEYVGTYIQVFGTSDPEKVVSKAELRIVHRHGRFSYKNPVTAKNGKPFPYEGYVFYTEKIIYFSGLNQNYARPFMCFVKPPNKALKNCVLRGGMLGLHDPSLNIYFREFILIPKGHKLFGQFKDATSDKDVLKLIRERLFAKELNPDPPIIG